MAHEPLDPTTDSPRPPEPGAREARWPTVALCALLVATGLLGWSYTVRPVLAVDTAPLAALPYAFEGYRGRDIPVEDDVAKLLQADFNLQRVYRDPLGGLVWLYVGYYGTERGGRTEHTPWVCYPSAGWTIERSDALTIDSERGLHVNEMVVERGGERRLVHFWFRSHRATGIRTSLGQLLDRVLGRLFAGRADGAFVRLSTPIGADGGATEARARLRSFGVLVEEQLARHWPRERAGTSAEAASARTRMLQPASAPRASRRRRAAIGPTRRATARPVPGAGALDVPPIGALSPRSPDHRPA